MNLRFFIALLLVALTGFISLSYEIAWIRVYNFVSASRAWVFGAMLGTYLLGLAFGALLSLRFQDAKDGTNPIHLKELSWFVLGANVFGFLLIPIVIATVPAMASLIADTGSWALKPFSYLITLPLVAIAAALLGATLPMICHFAIPPDSKAGANLSYLYLANILGSGAGSLFTGFILMDYLSIAEICRFLMVLGLLLSVGLCLFSSLRGKQMYLQIAMTVAIGVTFVFSTQWLYHEVYEKLQWKESYNEKGSFDLVVESRFGVITVDKDMRIYGGGINDGVLDTSLEPGSWLIRPYFVSAVHAAPKEVLVIGLSGGSWTQILLNNPMVERVTAIEINSAYEERVIPRYDSAKSILDNPKLTIVTDDGRRWLRHNPDRKFDLIVANTTYYFREHATNLLSVEFMEQVADHLNPQGIYMFNTTGSNRAQKTASTVFEHAYLLLNNIVASNETISFDKARWRAVLAEYEIDGSPVFDLTTAEGESDLDQTISILDHIDDEEIDKSFRLWSKEVMLDHQPHAHPKSFTPRQVRVITDDNLGHEFPYLPLLPWANYQ